MQNNNIGLNAAGTAILNNTGSGVHIIGAPGTIIGGPGAETRNILSGGAVGTGSINGHGVHIEGSTASGTLITGNYIGTNAAGTADLVLFMRTIHAWMAAGIAEKAFADAWAALRPGGVLGVEQHRLAPDDDQDPAAANGYVQEAFVRQLAAEAGFAFVAASEINANERDTKDHPFGVDTLPPMRLTAPRGSPPDPTFDRTKYDEIGESDRMTLRFRKPE